MGTSSESRYYEPCCGECHRPAVGHCQQCGLLLCLMCAETGAGFCKEHKEHPDAYDDLRQATPEELLEAIEWFFWQGTAPPAQIKEWISFVRTGWHVARPGGWEHVAPLWLQKSREEKEATQ